MEFKGDTWKMKARLVASEQGIANMEPGTRKNRADAGDDDSLDIDNAGNDARMPRNNNCHKLCYLYCFHYPEPLLYAFPLLGSNQFTIPDPSHLFENPKCK